MAVRGVGVALENVGAARENKVGCVWPHSDQLALRETMQICHSFEWGQCMDAVGVPMQGALAKSCL